MYRRSQKIIIRSILSGECLSSSFSGWISFNKLIRSNSTRFFSFLIDLSIVIYFRIIEKNYKFAFVSMSSITFVKTTILHINSFYVL